MSRTTIITEAHGRPYNDIEKANSFQMVVNALAGEWSEGEWKDENGVGFYVRQGSMWQGQIIYNPLPPGMFRLPFRVKNGLVSAYQLDVGTFPRTQKFVEDDHRISFNGLWGQRILIVVEPTKIVKE